jgi:signal transduction histidine kinase
VNDRDVVEFSVTDSGRGLTAEVSARLYEAFYSTKADGMGIGLSLCRSIVESHLGRMKAENIYNGYEATGCVFSFWLPCEQTETSAGTEPQLITKDVH